MLEEVKKVASRVATPEKRTRWVAWTSTAIAALGWAGAAWSAPITSNTALPVAEGEFVFREQFVLDRSGNDPSGAGASAKKIVDFQSRLGLFRRRQPYRE